MYQQRLPGEDTSEESEVIPFTEADRSEIIELAEFVKSTDLCSRVFPVFVQGFGEHTGKVFSDATKRIVRRIERIDTKGMHFSAPVVARVLWDYADWEQA